MKNFLLRLLVAFAIVFGGSTLISRPAQAYSCIQWDPFTLQCLKTNVDLLPGARWCGSNPAPGSHEVTIYTEINYGNTQGYCQVLPAPTTGNQIPYLTTYGYGGASGQAVLSIWVGANVGATFYSATNFGGSVKTLYGWSNYYENDTHSHWGWSPVSMYLLGR